MRFGTGRGAAVKRAQRSLKGSAAAGLRPFAGRIKTGEENSPVSALRAAASVLVEPHRRYCQRPFSSPLRFVLQRRLRALSFIKLPFFRPVVNPGGKDFFRILHSDENLTHFAADLPFDADPRRCESARSSRLLPHTRARKADRAAKPRARSVHTDFDFTAPRSSCASRSPPTGRSGRRRRGRGRRGRSRRGPSRPRSCGRGRAGCSR